MRTPRSVLAVPALLGAVAALLLGTPVAGALGAVAVDDSFAQNGRTTTIEGLPISWRWTTHKMAVAPNGDIYVAASRETNEFTATTELRRLLPDGQLDPTFGSGGAVAVAGPPETGFDLTELMVDAEGRPYIAGTTISSRDVVMAGVAHPSSATVIRYTTTGRPDPTYGEGGYARFTFGLPAYAPATEPAVSLGAAALDAEDRVILVPVLHGAWFSPHTIHFVAKTKFVTRLTATGTVDPTFAREGFFYLGPDRSVDAVSVATSGKIDLLTERKWEERGFQIRQLDANGAPDRSFGSGGQRGYPGHEPFPTWARGADGSFLLLGNTDRGVAWNHGSRTGVSKLGADGGPAKGFGHHGHVTIGLPGPSFLEGIASDGHGGAYLLGLNFTREDGGTWATANHEFLVMHLLPSGAVDPSFGRNGGVRLRFGLSGGAFAAAITPAGKLLVEGLAGPAPIDTSRQVLAQLSLG